MRAFLIAATLGLAAGCTSESTDSPNSVDATEIPAEVEEIPTDAQAEAAANDSITAENADAAFEALKAEIEADDVE
jgi:hypothetical protein